MAKKTPITVQFDGTENLQEIFQKMPMEYGRKPMIQTFRKAGRPLVNEIKQQATPTHRKLVGIESVKNAAAVRAGFKSWRGWNYWLRRTAYWKEYGTLENRAPGYSFKRPVRTKHSHWKGGIKPRMTVTTAWANKSAEVQNIVERDMEQITLRFLNKHAKK